MALEDLEDLVLSDNSILGSLPDELYELSKLAILSLPFNPISGSLSPRIGALKNLEILWMEDSSLTGSLPSELGLLTTLESLTLAGSSLRGVIPSDLRRLTNLNVLNLEDNFLSGTIPQLVADLPLLEEVNLSLNTLRGGVPDGNYASMRHFIVDSNKLTGTLPTSVLGNNLRTYSLTKNQFTGEIPNTWFAAPSVSVIAASGNDLTGSIPPSLGILFNLRELSLSDCGLTGYLPSELSNTQLEELNVEGNFLVGIVPNSYSELPLGECLQISCCCAVANSKLTLFLSVSAFCSSLVYRKEFDWW